MQAKPFEINRMAICAVAAAALVGCGGGGEPAASPAISARAPLAAAGMYGSDQLMDWAEGRLPELFPAHVASQKEGEYVFRYYPGSQITLGVAGFTGGVYIQGPLTGGQLIQVGRINDFGCAVAGVDCGPPRAPFIETIVPHNGAATVRLRSAEQDGPGVAAYVVACTSGPQTVTQISSRYEGEVVVTGLTNDQQYSCSARARNGFGDSGSWGSQPVTPRATAGDPNFIPSFASSSAPPPGAGSPSLWAPPAEVVPATGNYFYVSSDAGDFVGGANTGLAHRYLYLPPKLFRATVPSPGVVALDVDAYDAGWSIRLQGPGNAALLQRGYYPNVTRWPFHDPANGGMDVGGFAHGCSVLNGWFVVDDITYALGASLSYELSSISLRFEQRCEGRVPAVRGALRWAKPLDTQTQ